MQICEILVKFKNVVGGAFVKNLLFHLLII